MIFEKMKQKLERRVKACFLCYNHSMWQRFTFVCAKLRDSVMRANIFRTEKKCSKQKIFKKNCKNHVMDLGSKSSSVFFLVSCHVIGRVVETCEKIKG